jgi:hypothetical protein
MRQNYWLDVLGMRLGRVDDGAIRFTRTGQRTKQPA